MVNRFACSLLKLLNSCWLLIGFLVVYVFVVIRFDFLLTVQPLYILFCGKVIEICILWLNVRLNYFMMVALSLQVSWPSANYIFFTCHISCITCSDIILFLCWGMRNICVWFHFRAGHFREYHSSYEDSGGGHGRDGPECKWRQRMNFCEFDMWASTHGCWHILEAVGWVLITLLVLFKHLVLILKLKLTWHTVFSGCIYVIYA